MLGHKRSSLVSGKQSGENCFITYPPERVSEYIFLVPNKKNTHAHTQTKEKRKTIKQKAEQRRKGEKNIAVFNSICRKSNGIRSYRLRACSV